MDINNLSKRAQELWNEWEFRSLILLSLVLQILLVVIGNRRKYSSGIGLEWIVWIAYLSADWVATLALGIASRSQGEDNEIWSRHILQLAIQTAAASYFLFKSWGTDPLIYIALPVFVAGITKYGERISALPVFVAGITKYGERISALSQASSEKFRASEIGRNFNSELSEKFPSVGLFDMSIEEVKEDLGLNHSSYMVSYHIISSKKATEAFKLIELESGFVYNVFFTKVTRVSLPRAILRSISFLSSTSALVTFSLMIANKHAYPETELIISYILLGGGVVLEIYGAIMLLLSEWAMLHLSMLRKSWADSVYRAIYSDRNKGWERYMAQHDLTDAQITKNGALWKMVINSLVCKPTAKACFLKLIGKYNIQSWEVISDGLKELTWEYVLDKRSRYSHEMPQPDPGMNDLKEILAERGDQVLKSMGCLEEFRWAVVEIDFHGSLLLWHIATDICYHDDIRKKNVDAKNPPPYCKMSRSLSNYMLYLLIERPNMLPKGIGDERYKQTGIQVTEFSWCWRSEIITPTDWGSEEFLNKIKKNGNKVSMLRDACKLAKELQSPENNSTSEKKWRMISQIWVEMLAYAASNCGWKEYAQALTRGGELLTRVCLLMAHLGLSEQCLTTRRTVFMEDRSSGEA
ncbi:PREDICTED: uncharacterized protein LOC105117361 [Populus euphratica]|uniref:Uncharacterized protein LOC105117361 n=1 Tax=Populus euphratica TaxID=75702 RepID=A0AAJ6TM25_POPEU|nr:PREDICTED: uncharacterized protein LOC105117361 [Populus euphratica]